MTLINCPEGKIKLPIDLWYCKIVDESCPLQANINTEKWDEFHRDCLAPKSKQDEIRYAITSGGYQGFHHMPGRYLCPTCKPSRKGNWERAYHYPWELEPLDIYVPYNEEDLRIEIIKRGIPPEAQFGALCRKCLNDSLTRLGLPSVEDQLSRYRGYGEPLNQNEAISFRVYRSVRERQGGGPPIEDKCSWCGNIFSWNEKGESIRYDIFQIVESGRRRDGFCLCEHCGGQFSGLFGIT